MTERRRLQLRAANRRYYARHIEQERLRCRNDMRMKLAQPSFAKKNAEKAKVWREKNPEKSRQNAAEWRKKNPMQCLVQVTRRRARKLGARGSHTVEESLALRWKSGWRCYYCGQALNEKTVTEDHKTPLSRGGSNEIDNIVIACRPCNSSKYTMTDIEFVEKRNAAAL